MLGARASMKKLEISDGLLSLSIVTDEPSFNFRTAKDQHGRSVQNSSQRPGSFEYSHQSKVGTRDFKITKFSLKMN